jgi:HNH endonuclease
MSVHDRRQFEKLIAKVEIVTESGCWIWMGAYFADRPYAAHRYGLTGIKIDGVWRTRTTHRAMWYAVHGWPVKGLEVCHRCDVPLCCNPNHLFLGTHQENMQDSKQKGRHFLNRKTICKRGHPLSGDNLFVDQNGCRHCVACCTVRARIKAGWPEDLALTIPVGPNGYVPPEIAAIVGARRRAKSLETVRTDP